MVFADDPPPDAEWGDLGPITITDMSVYLAATDEAPAPDNYVPINHTRYLKATAFDKDCWRADENDTWHPYDDDVTSGDTETNHHMWWTVPAGSGKLTAAYGPSATYVAPTYSFFRWLTNGVSNVTVNVFAVDYNRGAGEKSKDPTTGFPDAQAGASIVLKVWQVEVTAQQSGTLSKNYSGEHKWPVELGGEKLGWIAHGVPQGSQGYFGGTQITGNIPDGPGVTTGYHWYQRTQGVSKYKVKNNDEWTEEDDGDDGEADPEDPDNWYTDINTQDPDDDYSCKDEDSLDKHGIDVRQIFLLDNPGILTGANNDVNIADSPFIAMKDKCNWTDYDHDTTYQTWVTFGDKRVSNRRKWGVKFTLEVQNDKWQVVGDHKPK